MKKLTLFCFLLYFLVFSQANYFDYPPHQKVYENNLNLVSRGPFIKQKPPWLSFQQPSLSNPFHYAFFKFTYLYPSVSNRTSAENLQSFFWIWGEEHPNYYIIYLTPDACGQSYRSFRAVSNSTLSGEVELNLGTISRTYYLTNNSSDPFLFDFSEKELSLLKSFQNYPFLPILELEFNGKINITYLVFEMDYIMEITKDGINCRAVSRIYHKTFSIPVYDKVTFEVEHHPISFFLLQPIDNEQLSFSPQAKFVFFTNSNANKIWVVSEDFIAVNKFANYSIKKDSFSFENIIRNDYPLPIKEKNFFSNSTLKFLNSSYFINSDYNFAHQYYSHIFLPHWLGTRKFYFYFLDDFNQVSFFDRDLISRSGQGIRKLLSEFVIIQTDKQAQNSSLSSFSNSFLLSTSEKNRGSFYSFFDSIKIIFSNSQIFLSIFIIGIISIVLWLKDFEF
ncbi:MAG: hypothetical protein NC918_00215 [Candidatus Omnitrophica bacterium]|nr:hypothetical protein [Candidatus Omnitrophota bacterium]